VLPGLAIHIPHRIYSLFEFLSIFLAGLGAFIALVRQRIRNMKEFLFDWEKE
jgi:hypothetical protein